MTVEIDTVLVPVDGTDAAARAVRYAVGIAARYDTGVHVLHVVDSELPRSVRSGTIDPETVAADQRSFLSAALEDSEDHDIPVSAASTAGFSASQLRRNPVTVVLEAAGDIGADFIVVPREDRSAILGKVADHVLSHASQPVLSV